MQRTHEGKAIEAAQRERCKAAWNYVPGVFRARFVSPWQQYRDRVGQAFTVLACYPPGDPRGSEEQDMYLIRFGDGTEVVAWGEEVCVEDSDPPARLPPSDG